MASVGPPKQGWSIKHTRVALTSCPCCFAGAPVPPKGASTPKNELIEALAAERLKAKRNIVSFPIKRAPENIRSAKSFFVVPIDVEDVGFAQFLLDSGSSGKTCLLHYNAFCTVAVLGVGTCLCPACTSHEHIGNATRSKTLVSGKASAGVCVPIVVFALGCS